MTPREMLEAARAAAGNAPAWGQKPAKIVLTLADGQEFVYTDVSLNGVARVIEVLGAP